MFRTPYCPVAGCPGLTPWAPQQSLAQHGHSQTAMPFPANATVRRLAALTTSSAFNVASPGPALAQFDVRHNDFRMTSAMTSPASSFASLGVLPVQLLLLARYSRALYSSATRLLPRAAGVPVLRCHLFRLPLYNSVTPITPALHRVTAPATGRDGPYLGGSSPIRKPPFGSTGAICDGGTVREFDTRPCSWETYTYAVRAV